MIRRPVVAGQFYPASEDALKRQLKQYVIDKQESFDAIGVVSPHAGYIYSGPVAGEVMASIKPKSVYLILGPNHTGYGSPFGIDPSDVWRTPLGDVKIDKGLAEKIIGSSRYIEEDSMCHAYEHSLEVQVPFLQYINGDKEFTIVPIVISDADRKIYEGLGKSIAGVLKEENDFTVVASSDMTHYEPQDSAEKKDKMAIDKILMLDIDGFLDVVENHNISMCGFAPTVVMMHIAKELGAKRCHLVKYATSGDTSGDYSAVVGYAGIVLY